MSKIKVSDYIAKRLKEKYGIRTFFLVSGGGAMYLNHSLGKMIPNYIAYHHEQAAAIAAEGFARTAQKLAVVNVTTGPGGLNCLNGVFGQWTDSVPVLYISGQVKKQTIMSQTSSNINLRQLGDQEVDIIATVKHLTKYAKMITNPNDIKYHLDKAIYEATTGRFGPVWLDIPIDVQSALVDENRLNEFIPDEQNLTTNVFKEANFVFQKLKSSKRPIIIVGHGIRLSNSIELLHQFIKKFNLPTLCTFNGFDIIPSNSKHYIGRIGTIGQRSGNFALQTADLVISLGSRNNIRQVSYNWANFATNAYKIAIDIDQNELEKPLVKFDKKIHCDVKDFLSEMLKIDQGLQQNQKWLNYLTNLKEKYSFENRQESVQQEKEIDPYYFTFELTKSMKEYDILTIANGSACVCTFQNAIVKENQRFILNSGNASMGYGLPCAIGVSAYLKAYNQNRNIICLEGDGSIMMNIQELQTIVHNHLPIKIFVINNNGYSSIRQTQRNFFNGDMVGSGAESGVSVPDFANLAKAFGIQSIKISHPSNIDKVIKDVLASKEAILCEVITKTEYAFLPKLSAKKLDDGSIVSPTLEDMFPFLPREEFYENLNII